MNHTHFDPAPGTYVVAAMVIFLSLLGLFVLIVQHCCKCTCFHYVWLRFCPADYTRVELEEIQNANEAQR